MVAYNFKPCFVQPILDGVKLHTIRSIRLRGHARRGDELQLYTGLRSQGARLIARKVCAGAYPVIIDRRHGRIVVQGEDFPWKTGATAAAEFATAGAEFVAVKISGTFYSSIGELDAFAQRDGFSGFYQMREFWDARHSQRTDSFAGTLIGWWSALPIQKPL